VLLSKFAKHYQYVRVLKDLADHQEDSTWHPPLQQGMSNLESPEEAPDSGVDLGEAMEPASHMVPIGEEDERVSKHLASAERFFGRAEVNRGYSSDSHIDEIVGCVKTIVDLFIVYGLKFVDSKDTVRATRTAVQLCLDSGLNWDKYFKTRIADFFSSWTGQELSNFPYGQFRMNPKYLLGGQFYGFTRRLCKTGQLESIRTKMEFVTSFLQSKKGMPRASDESVKKAEHDNMVIMTTPKAPVAPYRYKFVCVLGEGLEFDRDIMLGRTFIEGQLRRGVREIFRGWSFTLDDWSRPVFPSTSSNYNRTRTKKGTYGEINTRNSWMRFVREVEDEPLRYALRNTWLDGYQTQYYGQLGRDDCVGCEDVCFEAPGLEVNTKRFDQAYKRLHWGLVNEAMDETAKVEVVGLKEALKIRCISKGPPITYFVLKNLQNSMWNQLSKHEVFKLTNTVITEENFRERFEEFDDSYRFHSGDYSAATDGLFSWVSECIANEIVDIAEERNGFKMDSLRTLFIKSLTRHIYVCDRIKAIKKSIAVYRQSVEKGTVLSNEEIQRISDLKEEKHHLYGQRHQQRGQLMGSITSFPILCIANFALMRLSLEIAEKNIGSYSLRDFPGWINGDDCLTPYKSNLKFPKIWERLAHQFGFEKSLGKTYDSDYFCSMNSTTFFREGNQWHLAKYVNLGLLYGVKRSQAANDGPLEPIELGVLHEELMETCPAPIQRSLTNCFLHQHHAVLNTFSGPWFLPNWMGGLGLRQLNGYSDEDRIYARHACEEATAYPVSFSRDKEWLHYDLFNNVVKVMGDGLVTKHNYESYVGDEHYGRAFKAIVFMEGWVRDGLSALYNPHLSEEQQLTQKLRELSLNIYDRVREAKANNDYRKCLSDEVFNVESKKFCVPVFAKYTNYNPECTLASAYLPR